MKGLIVCWYFSQCFIHWRSWLVVHTSLTSSQQIVTKNTNMSFHHLLLWYTLLRELPKKSLFPGPVLQPTNWTHQNSSTSAMEHLPQWGSALLHSLEDSIAHNFADSSLSSLSVQILYTILQVKCCDEAGHRFRLQAAYIFFTIYHGTQFAKSCIFKIFSYH